MLGPTLLSSGAFVTVDIETTGCRPGTSAIIEIGAARVEAGTITGRFESLVLTSEPIPPVIERLTGISLPMLADAPALAEVMATFREFAEGAVLVAHNHRFDMNFLDFEAESVWGTPFPRPVLDTLSLSRRLHPELVRHNLHDLAHFYGTTVTPTHRALPDALATAEVFVKMRDELLALDLHTAADAARLCGVAQEGRLASKLPLATRLPDAPGVYLFRDDRGAVIFVGRAKSLRARVRNHFYAPSEPACPTPATRVASVSHASLASTLDAALLEVRLQDRYTPEFNRDGHQQRTPLYLHVDTGAEFPSLEATPRRPQSGALLGPLSSEWATSTIADALSDHYGLRRCRSSVAECEGRDCERRQAHLCQADDAYAAGQDAYASGVRAALEVFNGRGPEFRDILLAMQADSAKHGHYEDAARYRDAIRALDRTLGALGVARRASAESVTAIVEGDDNAATVILVVHGWRFTTVRLTRDDVVHGRAAAKLAVALTRAASAAASDGAITPRRLRDMAIIDAYRQQHAPLTVKADGDPAQATASVVTALRRHMRVPRKRHHPSSLA